MSAAAKHTPELACGMSPDARYLKRQQWLLGAALNGHNRVSRTEVATRMRNLRRIAAQIIAKAVGAQHG